jgi:amidase
MYNYIESNIFEIKNDLESGKITSYDLVLSLLDRIANVDQGEVKFNSILEINPDALNIAKALDFERSNGKVRGLMHGIPVVLKDNINTGDKMHTTAGSISLKKNFASKDAFIVKRLRDEGAVILGKANLTEFANFMSYNMRNGYSSLGGEVLCPWNLKHDPSGSSAGSAVSVTLNLTPVSIGSETGGSIMSPSMQNGVVGMKPTIGLVSRTGIIPISSTLDTAGPIGKNVTDVSILLSSLRGNDLDDPVTLTKNDEKVDYTKYLIEGSLKGARIGIDKNRYSKLSDEAKTAFKDLISVMKEAGAVIVEDLDIKQPSLIFNIMKHEFKRNINKYLSTTSTNVKVKTLKDIVKYNEKHEIVALKYGQKLLEDCLATDGKMNNKEYLDGLLERDETSKSIKRIFEEHKLDLIYFSSYTSIGPECGFPTMTIPIGYSKENIPLGSYFLANHFKEDKLISILYSLEQLINKRRNPLNE